MLVILVKIVLVLALIVFGPLLILAAVMAGRFKKKSLIHDPFLESRQPLRLPAQNVTETTETAAKQLEEPYGDEYDFKSVPTDVFHYQIDYKCEEVVKKSKKKKSKKNKKKSKK